MFNYTKASMALIVGVACALVFLSGWLLSVMLGVVSV